jgi:hypothetical protein
MDSGLTGNPSASRARSSISKSRTLLGHQIALPGCFIRARFAVRRHQRPVHGFTTIHQRAYPTPARPAGPSEKESPMIRAHHRSQPCRTSPEPNRHLWMLGTRYAPTALTAAAVALGCALPSTAAARSGAPCTKSALNAGLHRGADPLPRGQVVSPFGCLGDLAYASVVMDGNGQPASVFRARHGRWATVSRRLVCNHRLTVPHVMYHWACEVS